MVEKSYLGDHHEFYQMLDRLGEIDLRNKAEDWINYYSFLRPHLAHAGKTLNDRLKQRILGWFSMSSYVE
jgi:hypothetical protein